LKAQLERYDDLDNDMKSLSEFTTRKKSVDFAGFIALNDKGQEIFTFGKHKGALVDDVLDKEPGYFGWIQNAEFPLYTKKVLTAIKLRKLNTK
jgi:DNA polymerase-3 subunit epsilon